jgi:hypothetical protein
MTGTPMPSDPMSRMQMAPAVYDFTKNFAKKPNLLEKTGNLVKTVGKIGLMGLGQGFKQSQANEQRAIQEQLRTQAEAKQAEALVTGDSNVERQKTPAEIIEDKRMARLERTSELKQQERDDKQEKAMDMLKAKKENLVGTPIKGSYTRTKMIKTDPPQYEEEVIDPFAQQATTADNYQQDFVPNQTSSGLIDRKIEQGSQIADETPNVAEVLSESQDSRQSEFADPEDVQKQMESDMIGGSLGKNQLSKFLKQKGLDQALLGAVGDRTTETPRIGDDSPLLDHPDVAGGEDDIALPGGTNTSSTQDLSSFHKEMRKMDALERMAEQSPSTKQIALDEMNKSREGFMAQDGPNKDAYDAKQRIAQRAKDQMLEQMKKNDEDEERIKKLNLNQDRPTTTTPEQKENFKKLVAAQELQKVFPESQDPSLLDPLGVLNDPKFMRAVRKGQNKARLESNLVSDRVDDFTAKFVEGARSDIVRGARGNKSLGITRIPATNGDAQVGFVLANKPLDQSPTTATTYGFGVAPGAESLLDNQLTKDTFSSYMQRGMSEAKKGIKRKAGEIFEYLPKNRRVVGGTASLGDIVM